MCKFSQNQGIHTLDITSNEIFHNLLPISYQKPLNNIVHNIDSLSLLRYAQSRLEIINSFSFEKIKQNLLLVPPFLEDVLNADVNDQLNFFYSLLYPEYDSPNV